MMKLGKTLGVAAAALFLAQGAWGANPHEGRIKGPLADGRAATAQCLKCHEEEARQIMRTTHWSWSAVARLPDGRTEARGKKNMLNNFCLAIASNWSRCTGCHISYGWEDAKFDFSDPKSVDCLVCHDTTGSYKKDVTRSGEPFKTVDLLEAAQKVGKPQRFACGSCHFKGGGGEAVKHGDLDSSLEYPDRKVDVHMSPDGLDFTCQQCHTEGGHKLVGASLGVSPTSGNHFGCDKCHTLPLHKNPTLDRHSARVACQSCHIPAFARGESATKMSWDWSTAGRDDLSADAVDQYGEHTYQKIKGSFTWGKNVIPSYRWFNGSADAYMLGDRIDPAKTTVLNAPHGSRSDPKAKIFPFKLHKGVQPYDSVNKILLPMHTAGENGFWKTFDWKKSLEAGARANGLKFSGEYGFARTEMWWKINHMVAPKEAALKCADCHGGTGRIPWKELGYPEDPMVASRK